MVFIRGDIHSFSADYVFQQGESLSRLQNLSRENLYRDFKIFPYISQLIRDALYLAVLPIFRE
jgi:hypothetical protein